jgi:hypothetical protein
VKHLQINQLTVVRQVLIHGLYFDNFPHGHYGTIRQQVWSLLHFPLQLAIVGIVEGSQQIAMARYVMKSAYKAQENIAEICEEDHLDGEELRDALLEIVEYFQFQSKTDTSDYQTIIEENIYSIGNATGICSAERTDQYSTGNWPSDFVVVDQAISNGLYTGLGVKIPIDKLREYMSPIDIAMKSWRITYMYYWSSFCLLITCLLIFLVLIRRHKADTFDFVSLITRCLVLIAGGAMMAIMASDRRLYELISSPAVLPACVVLLFLILVADKLSAVWSNYRLLRSGEPYGLEVEAEHHGHHDANHDGMHLLTPLPGHAHGPRDSIGLKANRMSAWSIHADAATLAQEDTAYNPNGMQSYATEPVLSPPFMSPPLLSPEPSTAELQRPGARGGYMAIHNEHS